MENNSWWLEGEEENKNWYEEEPVMDFSSQKTKKPAPLWYEEQPVMDFAPRRKEGRE